MRAGRGRGPILALAALTASLAACTAQGPGAATPDPSTSSSVPAQVTPAPPVKLTFGVWGDEGEVASYQQVADSYNAVTDESDVSLTPYADESALVTALQAGRVPDVFLISRRDLVYLREKKLNRPLSSLLDERSVDFGDGYSRDALEAFSFDRDLQCMPYGIAPDVIFYNKRWVDFDKMRARDLPVPNLSPNPRVPPRWSFEQFQAAAEFATRQRRGVHGLYVDPTVRGLAPFLYSGGGQVFDDDDEPTSLAFSDGGSRDALEQALPLLRDAQVNLTAEQVSEATPREWFERGKLGMFVGTRDDIPSLRATEGLDFDVMPMPVLDDDATVGDITGICVSAKAASIGEAADFLVQAISAGSVGKVVQAGHLSPANQVVAFSDTFLEPDKLPIHSVVFVTSIRSMRIPALLRDRSGVEAAVAADVASLITLPLLPPDQIDAITEKIDAESRAVLDPESVQSADPESESESESE